MAFDAKQCAGALAQKVINWLKRYPYHNILLLILLAPAGYLFPLLFPALLIFSVDRLLATLEVMPLLSWPAVLDWWPVVLWLAAIGFSLRACNFLLRLRLQMPDGYQLHEESSPELFNLIREIAIENRQMPIGRVIVTPHFELDIVKTPVCVLPVWSRNTLVVGLPLVQMMPPNVFRAMVARKLCQHNWFRNPLLHWLHQCHGAWQQYLGYCLQHRSPVNDVLAFFYLGYAAIYRRLVEPVARLDGLSADRRTLKIINDEDIVESIEYLFVVGMYIEKIFWPRLRNFAYKNNRYDLFPFAALAKSGLESLSRLDVNQWLAEEMNRGHSPRWGVSSMATRLDALGHNEVFPLYIISDSAAGMYIGRALPGLIEQTDSEWRTQCLPAWQAVDDIRRKQQALLVLLQKQFAARGYSLSDWYQYVRHAVELRVWSAAKLLLKMVLFARLGSSRASRTLPACT